MFRYTAGTIIFGRLLYAYPSAHTSPLHLPAYMHIDHGSYSRLWTNEIEGHHCHEGWYRSVR